MRERSLARVLGSSPVYSARWDALRVDAYGRVTPGEMEMQMDTLDVKCTAALLEPVGARTNNVLPISERWRAGWVVRLGEAIRGFIHRARVQEMLTRWRTFAALDETERLLFRAMMTSSRLPFSSRKTAACFISEVLPRKRLGNRDVMIDVLCEISQHVAAVRLARAKSKEVPTVMSFAQVRLAREIGNMFARCDFRSSASRTTIHHLTVVGGKEPGVAVERRSVVDQFTTRGSVYSSHREVETIIAVPWRWMRIVKGTLGENVVVKHGSGHALVLDLRPTNTTNVFRAVVVAQWRGLGLRIDECDVDLRPETDPATTLPPTPSLTDKQTVRLGQLPTNDLTARAVEAMHALNRRAKVLRDRRNEHVRASAGRPRRDDIDAIYALKDGFLDAMVRAGRATLYTFDIEVDVERAPQTCTCCHRTWFGDDYCHGCDDYTGDVDVPTTEIETWYIVDCGSGYRFHQPDVAADLRERAIPIEPHDPQQPQREIPKIGLTIAAQKACVEMATACLGRMAAKEVAS